MSKPRIYPGQRFGRLTVIYETLERANTAKLWMCQCDCGEATFVTSTRLLNAKTASCGCYAVEKTKQRFTTHGHRYTRVYRTWGSMFGRCRNPNSAQYPDYGGRGIKVCDRWLTFENFLADMGYPPEGHSIDRIDVDGNYCPENCRWLDDKGQQRNRRSNRRLEFNGEILPISEWAERTGIKSCTIAARINRKSMSVEQALTTPARRPKGRTL